MRGEPDLLRLLRTGRPGEYAVVPPVVAEIEYGIQRLEPASRKRRLLEVQRNRYLEVLRQIPWDDESSQNYGTIKANLEKRGELIDDFDIAIAAIALSHDAEVITANLAHFKRVTGLACRHWTDRTTE